MTKEEEKEVLRVCGESYEDSDTPAYIRKRDIERLEVEERLVEEHRQERLEREEKERLGLCVT